MKKCKIIATNALDEYLISDLEKQNAAIDSYGVGDAIATSKHNPCFGNVFKLVQLDEKPILKRSEDKIKLINPGFQVTYRIIKNGIFKVDVTCLRGDALAMKIEGREAIAVRDEFDENKTTSFEAGSYEFRVMQEKVVDKGNIIYSAPDIEAKRNYYLSNLSKFNDTQTRIINPHFYKVDISDGIYDLKKDLINNINKEIEQMDKDVIIKPKTHVVVDMIYDFIDGSLACVNANNAIKKIVEHINSNPDERVLYVCDSHPVTHCSFEINGGTWPVHCVEGSKGSSLATEFFEQISHIENKPSSANNIYYKGRDKDKEEYSGWQATNAIGKKIEEVVTEDVIISGVATEFCVRETVLALLKKSHKVSIIKDGLAYLDEANHLDVLKELESLGAKII